MWLRTIFRRRRLREASVPQTALDERLLRRVERLVLASARKLPGGISGAHLSRRRLPAPTFSDHRPYTAGDDLRYVDWNAYARLDHLHLKLGEAEQDIRVHLLADSSSSMDWGDGDRNKLHYTRLLSAAIGYIALASGDHLRVRSFGAARAPGWGTASGRHRAAELLQFLGNMQPGGSQTIQATLEQAARDLHPDPRGGLLIIISDLLHSDGLPDALLRFQPPRWQVLVLHVLHPQELRPELRGDAELLDSESQARLVLEIDRPALDQYVQAVHSWCDALADTLGRYGVAYARLATDMPLERAVIPYLRVRGVLW